jgi:lipopolysaccharide transport system ATP-binding protein
MYVRLAFAVAAHLEPEILIIDEVLSVGDAVFQKKCLGKMDDVSKNQGRTILFVSHDIAAVKQLTHRCVVLKGGKLQYFGPTATAVEIYHGETEAEAELRKRYVFTPAQRKWPGSGEVKMLGGEFAVETPIFTHESDVEFELTVSAENYRGPLRVSATIFCDDAPVGGTFGEEFQVDLHNQKPSKFAVKLKNPRFAPGKYHFDIAIGRGSHLTQRVEYDIVSEVMRFEVLPPTTVTGTLSKWEKGWGSVLFLPLVCETT